MSDDKLHYVCYRDGTDALWCSEKPEEVKAEKHDVLLRSFSSAVLEHPEPFSRERLTAVREDLMSVSMRPDLPQGAVISGAPRM